MKLLKYNYSKKKLKLEKNYSKKNYRTCKFKAYLCSVPGIKVLKHSTSP